MTGPADGERRYRPFQAGPFRWRLGLRPLDLHDWIEVDDRYERDVARKRELVATHPGTVFGAMPGVEEEAGEVLDALVEHLRHRWPARFGDVEPDRSRHPLEAAGLLVQEDLALLVPRDGRLVFGAGSICFPNRWDLRSKIGLPLAAVHAPVARLNAELEEPIDRFFDRLTPERSFWRLGWGVLDTAELYQPLDGTAPARPSTPGFGDLHLRVERETLRRFPVTGCVLFTIRTHLTPLPDLVVEPEAAARLADALDELPPDVAEYKQLEQLGTRAASWLRAAIQET